MQTPFRADTFKHSSHLPEHQVLSRQVLDFFKRFPGVEGGFVSGSHASGGMDEFSDLDFGFLCRDQEAREAVWQARWDWQIAPWFHRFDADHIKPYFVIYFFEPSIHVDLNFYLTTDLPTAAGAPFVVAWDNSGQLDPWAERVNRPVVAAADWSQVVHEDERFWAWIHYGASHALRGEFYDTADWMFALRNIVESWEARINGLPRFSPRRAEQKWSPHFITTISAAFCAPERASIRKAFEALIALQLRQREVIAAKTGARWKTSPQAIAHIWALVQRV